MDPFKDYNKERLFELIYTGVVTLKKLPKGLFNRTLKHLVNGLMEGINLEYDFKDEVLLKELRTNLYLFSGAKTEVQVMDMIGTMVGEDGKILPYNKFKKLADIKFEQYNKNYLRTEYDTAIGQGQMVSKWDDIMSKKEHFNYLEYDAILDGRTSDLCRHFDGITLPVDDKFWKTYSPLNHFNCRCTIHQVSKYDDPISTEKEKVKEAKENADKEGMSDVFKMNPYFDKVVFSKNHPYFEQSLNYKQK